MHPNLTAFLTMIAKSEGVLDVPGNDNGYNVLCGGRLFHSYHDHPRRRVWVESIKKYSSAAGRYQILERYFDFYKKELKLPGPDFFSPENQDLIAQRYIIECHALDDILDGRIEMAIDRCKSRWASLPGANYAGQRMNKLDDLLVAYKGAGGWLA